MQTLAHITQALLRGLSNIGRNRAIANLKSYGYEEYAQRLEEMKNV